MQRDMLKTPRASLLYSRIDMAHDDQRQLCVMEVELIEPSLFLKQSPQGLERFVNAIVQ